MSRLLQVRWPAAVAAFATAVLLQGCGGSPDVTSVRVVELLCSGSWNTAQDCKGQFSLGSDLTFRLNAVSHSGVIIVSRSRNAGLWLVHTLLLPACTIVDAENWQCTHVVVRQRTLASGVEVGLNELYEMRDGVYSRTFKGMGDDGQEAEIHGLTGWRYWWWRLTGEVAM